MYQPSNLPKKVPKFHGCRAAIKPVKPWNVGHKLNPTRQFRNTRGPDVRGLGSIQSINVYLHNFQSTIAKKKGRHRSYWFIFGGKKTLISFNSHVDS